MAIEYLHHGNDTPIVHCDLKPANVLLDEDMVAHVGDFGISKILAISKSMAHTETLCTLGYIALEYGSEGIVTTSVDVYSYGIMLMEVLTKRRPTDEEICNENLGLRKWIIQSFSGTMMDIIDDNLFHEEEQITSKSEICIASMFELALDCTMEMPESRITMKDRKLLQANWLQKRKVNDNSRGSRGFMNQNHATGFNGGKNHKDSGRFNASGHHGNKFALQVNTQTSLNSFNNQFAGGVVGQSTSTSCEGHKEANNAAFSKVQGFTNGEYEQIMDLLNKDQQDLKYNSP
ncbi:receptor kinase-like protein Xa21 [Capsicum annuum]|uniref:receptor kinase-like protein Xa21 n=1 Tax=Capsicum annuum TaxID=4072 RepID=UPI001FB0ADBF|nr:receptor kinase-like protein Xa21 [Capsicum annuum]